MSAETKPVVPITMSAQRERTLRSLPGRLVGTIQISEVFAELDALRARLAEKEEQLAEAQRVIEAAHNEGMIVSAEKVRELWTALENYDAAMSAVLSKPEGAMCRCGHAKEQHEGHTYQPGAEPPTHCSADCSCLEFVAGKTPRPKPNTDVIQQPEHLAKGSKGAHDAIFGGEGTTKEKA